MVLIPLGMIGIFLLVIQQESRILAPWKTVGGDYPSVILRLYLANETLVVNFTGIDADCAERAFRFGTPESINVGERIYISQVKSYDVIEVSGTMILRCDKVSGKILNRKPL